jgi:hypothetical protein
MELTKEKNDYGKEKSGGNMNCLPFIKKWVTDGARTHDPQNHNLVL